MQQVISGIDLNKATWGQITPLVIKWGAEVYLSQIYLIIKTIVTQPDLLPEAITTSNICLLHKKGDKAEPKNYRPIALRHFIMNILDKWIYQQIKPHIKFEEEQYGFTESRGADLMITNLTLIQEIAKAKGTK